eukprot:6511736-Prymnesium_polylepis.1
MQLEQGLWSHERPRHPSRVAVALRTLAQPRISRFFSKFAAVKIRRNSHTICRQKKLAHEIQTKFAGPADRSVMILFHFRNTSPCSRGR